MRYPITLFSAQWADVPFAEFAEKVSDWGYDGVELASKNDHFDIERGAADPAYCEAKREQLATHGLGVWALSNHRCGHLVCGSDDPRTDAFVHEGLRGDPARKQAYGIEQMKLTAPAARNLGVSIVTGFTGSEVWPFVYRFPAVSDEEIDAAYERFAQLWNPILDVFGACGVRFALEVHPAQVAYDVYTTERALAALGNRPEFGLNFDPSHLYWQHVDPVQFLRAFPERIYHVHVKDCAFTLDGKSSVLGSHLNFGDRRRGWDFRSAGRGGIDWGEIFTELHEIGYDGPLSVEWEDSRMDREWGARDACRFVSENAFPAPALSLDQALGNTAKPPLR